MGLAFVVFWIGYEALQLFLMLDWLSGARFAEIPIYPGLVPSLWEVPAWWARERRSAFHVIMISRARTLPCR